MDTATTPPSDIDQAMAPPAAPPAPPPTPPVVEKDVEFTGGEESIASQPTPEEALPEPPEDVLDVLKPKKEVRTWRFGNEDFSREYVQRPLSFIAKMQWFSLVGDVLDRAMGGDNPLTIGNLLAGPNTQAGFRMEDFREADTFVQAVGKLVYHAPDFLVKSYCIWLGVPDYERDLAAELMSRSPEEGGLTDEAGIEIIEIFIDQNYEALDSFFRDKLGSLQKRVETRVAEAGSARSKR